MQSWYETVHEHSLENQTEWSGLLCMDLDGTLIHGDRTLNNADVSTLLTLQKKNWLRIIATGRSLESFKRALPDLPSLPVDYLVFSSGVGIIHTPSETLIRTVNFKPSAVNSILTVLNTLKLDYMIHHPAPDNVRFSFWQHSPSHQDNLNHDFHRRLKIYDDLITPLDTPPEQWPEPSAQIITVLPPGNPSKTLESIKNQLPDFNVVRTTSPLDGQSTWIEIYPNIVSKGHACQWLKDRHSPEAPAIAVGNDYNDLDLLTWADYPFVVHTAPTLLLNQFPVISRDNIQSKGVVASCIKTSVTS